MITKPYKKDIFRELRDWSGWGALRQSVLLHVTQLLFGLVRVSLGLDVVHAGSLSSMEKCETGHGDIVCQSLSLSLSGSQKKPQSAGRLTSASLPSIFLTEQVITTSQPTGAPCVTVSRL